MIVRINWDAYIKAFHLHDVSSYDLPYSTTKMHLQLCVVRETRFMNDTDEMVNTVPYTGELY